MRTTMRTSLTAAALLLVLLPALPACRPTGARVTAGARGNAPAAAAPSASSPSASSPSASSPTPSSPSAVVDAQFAAYNRRDLDAFMATLAPDARLYAFPDSLLHAGHDELRRVYGRLFAQAPRLRAELLHRTVQGRFVIDRETTYGLPGREPLTGVAISEVIDGRIARVWFVD